MGDGAMQHTLKVTASPSKSFLLHHEFSILHGTGYSVTTVTSTTKTELLLSFILGLLWVMSCYDKTNDTPPT